MRQRYAGEDNQGPCRRVWRTVGQHGDELEALKGNMQLHHFEDLSGCTLKLWAPRALDVRGSVPVFCLRSRNNSNDLQWGIRWILIWIAHIDIAKYYDCLVTLIFGIFKKQYDGLSCKRALNILCYWKCNLAEWCFLPVTLWIFTCITPAHDRLLR